LGASDYTVVQPPNFAAYANPNFGLALGQQISNLPGAYMQGREMARKRAMQTPILDPQTGEPSQDPDTIINELMKRGGGEYSAQMLPFIYGNKLMRQNAGLQPPSMEGNEPGPTLAPFARAAAQPAQSQPRYSSSGADNSGDQTFLANVATKVFGERDVSPLIDRYAKALGIDPSDPLTPAQEQQAEKWMRNSAATTGAAPAPSEVSRPAEATSAAEVGNNVGGAGPALAGGAPSGGPAPVGGTAPTALAQAGGGTANVDAAGTAGGPVTAARQWEARQRAMPPDQATGLPPGYTEKTAANWYKYAGQKAAIGNTAAVTGNKALAEQAKSEADHAFTMAQKIRDAIKERAAFTNEQKNARDVPVQAQKIEDEVRKGDIATGEKTFKGLQEAGVAGRLGNEKLDVIRTQMSDPNFFSGAGSDLVKKFQQWSVSLGGNPRAAEPMEEFHKTAIDLLNEQIRAMAGAGVSRIQLAEIRNMKESIASLGISPASNRYLAEEMYRIHKANVDLADLARQYRAQHQYLDSGWETIRDRYYATHPLFSKEEVADPRLIAPPYLPAAIASDPARHKQWVRNQGIKVGDPIKTNDPRRPIIFATQKSLE